MASREIVLITGNPGKLAELQVVFPPEVGLDYEKLDIEEIQGEGDSRKIVDDKLRRAYEAIGKPVIVEDVSAELVALNGLPGPFVKFFERPKKEGGLGKGGLYILLLGHDDKRATIRCTMGYFDGQADPVIVEGVTHGTIVEPRGENGFGFDSCFVPDGHTRTQAEMTPEEKNQISYRYLAAKALTEALFPV